MNRGARDRVCAGMLNEAAGSVYAHNIPPRSIACCDATGPDSLFQVGQFLLVEDERVAGKAATFRVVASNLSDADVQLFKWAVTQWDLPPAEQGRGGQRWSPGYVARLLGALRSLEHRLEGVKAELAPILLSFAEET